MDWKKLDCNDKEIIDEYTKIVLSHVITILQINFFGVLEKIQHIKIEDNILILKELIINKIIIICLFLLMNKMKR